MGTICPEKRIETRFAGFAHCPRKSKGALALSCPDAFVVICMLFSSG